MLSHTFLACILIVIILQPYSNPHPILKSFTPTPSLPLQSSLNSSHSIPHPNTSTSPIGPTHTSSFPPLTLLQQPLASPDDLISTAISPQPQPYITPNEIGESPPNIACSFNCIPTPYTEFAMLSPIPFIAYPLPQPSQTPLMPPEPSIQLDHVDLDLDMSAVIIPANPAALPSPQFSNEVSGAVANPDVVNIDGLKSSADTVGVVVIIVIAMVSVTVIVSVIVVAAAKKPYRPLVTGASFSDQSLDPLTHTGSVETPVQIDGSSRQSSRRYEAHSLERDVELSAQETCEMLRLYLTPDRV